MPYFYHYTDDEGAQNIIRSGRILTSLTFMTGDDAAFGNGVYLTKLNPQTSTKSAIALNNWRSAGASFINRTKNYFVIDIPDSEIKNTEASGRNIFVFGRRNDLILYKYSWWLKNFDFGQIIASYKYHLASFGPVSTLRDYEGLMGDYFMMEDTANGRPVYKHSDHDTLIFMSSNGQCWYVGPDAGQDKGWLKTYQVKYNMGPDSQHTMAILCGWPLERRRFYVEKSCLASLRQYSRSFSM